MYQLPRVDWAWGAESETRTMLAQGELAQAARMREHDAFMSSMQRGADLRNEQFRTGQYEKQRRSDNFVDYVLDCSRYYGTSSRLSVGNNCPDRQT